MFPVTYLSSLIREVMLVVNINFITLFSFMEDGCLMNCSLPSFISNWIWFNLWKAWVIFSLSWIGLKMWQLRVCKLIENNIICYFSFISFLTLTSEFISVFVKIFSFYHEEFNQFHNWCQFTHFHINLWKIVNWNLFVLKIIIATWLILPVAYACLKD